jgi:uroporphyrinogen III methyltransferase / synthase
MTVFLKPLTGKRIVVTRPKDQAAELTSLLESYGAEVLLVPVLSFDEPTYKDLMDAALRALSKIDWILFTSENAARYLAARAAKIGVDIRAAAPHTKIAVVGPATASAAESVGWYVSHVAKNHNSQSLAEELHRTIAGKRVLLPRSDLANDELPRALRQSATQVIEIVCYRTISSSFEQPTLMGRIRGTEEPHNPEREVLDRVRRGAVDVVTFASPSAVQHFSELLGPQSMRALSDAQRFATIGPTTSRAVTDAGWQVTIEARESTSKGLADAIAAHFSPRPPGVARP